MLDYSFSVSKIWQFFSFLAYFMWLQVLHKCNYDELICRSCCVFVSATSFLLNYLGKHSKTKEKAIATICPSFVSLVLNWHTQIKFKQRLVPSGAVWRHALRSTIYELILSRYRHFCCVTDGQTRCQECHVHMTCDYQRCLEALSFPGTFPTSHPQNR